MFSGELIDTLYETLKEKLDEVVSERDALAAENAGLREALGSLRDACNRAMRDESNDSFMPLLEMLEGICGRALRVGKNGGT